jgi:hypothetical protein
VLKPALLSERVLVLKVSAGCSFDQSGADCGHSLALSVEGQVFSWGVGFYGQLGHGDKRNLLSPRPLDVFSTGEGGWNRHVSAHPRDSGPRDSEPSSRPLATCSRYAHGGTAVTLAG